MRVGLVLGLGLKHAARALEGLGGARLHALRPLVALAQLVEVVEDLLAQVALDLGDLLEQLLHLLDVCVFGEVNEQRVDRLQQVGRLGVHALLVGVRVRVRVRVMASAP